MKRKALIIVPFAILAALAIPTIAQAHSGTASGTCQQGVQWDYHNYDKTLVNTITVTIDGTVRHHDADMKASDAGTIATDKTVGHNWDVRVDAPGTQYDRHLYGSYGACETAPTTTVVSTTTLPATTTTLPATTTTVVVEVGIPPVPTTAAPSSVSDVAVLTPEPTLPATGGNTGLGVVAVVISAIGLVFALLGRRVR